MIAKRLLRLGLLALAFASGALVRPVAVSAASCTATITAPTFATYYPLSTNLTAADADTTAGAINLTCPGYSSGYVTVTYASTKMAGPGSSNLTYSIYEPGSSTTVWPSTTYQAAFSPSGGGKTATINYNASIAGAQGTVQSGAFSDTTTYFSASYGGGALSELATGSSVASATVAQECDFQSGSPTTVAFSPYDPIGTNASSGSDETTTYQALYECTDALSTYKITFTSAHASGTTMRMISGTKYLTYYVHDTAGNNFPSGTAETAASQETGNGYNQLSYLFTVGIAKGQNPGNGSYTDSNVVTLTP